MSTEEKPSQGQPVKESERCEPSQSAPVKKRRASNLREELAAYAHEAWSGWMEYMFAQCQPIPPTTVSGDDYWLHIKMPKALYERWTRQMTTKYADLPESEKESDREEAVKIVKRIWGFTEEHLSELIDSAPEARENFRKFVEDL